MHLFPFFKKEISLRKLLTLEKIKITKEDIEKSLTKKLNTNLFIGTKIVMIGKKIKEKVSE